MFARVKKSGQYEYIQIVHNRREGTKTIQRVVATIGRMDQVQKKGEIDSTGRWLSWEKSSKTKNTAPLSPHAARRT